MLTAQDLRTIRKRAVEWSDGCYPTTERLTSELCDAYERVVALLDEWEGKSMNPGPNDKSEGFDHLCFLLELRRAMEGK
jgi:hypothetical protein